MWKKHKHFVIMVGKKEQWCFFHEPDPNGIKENICRVEIKKVKVVDSWYSALIEGNET